MNRVDGKKDLVGRIGQYVQEGVQKLAEKGRNFSDTLVRSRRSGSPYHTVPGFRAGASKYKSVYSKMTYGRYITTAQASRLASYAPSIEHAASTFRVPVELICAVILQESGGKSNAVSHCGAKGLMQLMPGTARTLGVANSLDPHQNIMGGTKYLRDLLNRFDGNIALALAGYNAGEGNVEKYGRRIPPFRETLAYVPSVLKYADTLWRIFASPVKRIAIQPTVTHHTIFTSSRKV